MANQDSQNVASFCMARGWDAHAGEPTVLEIPGVCPGVITAPVTVPATTAEVRASQRIPMKEYLSS